MKKGGPAFQLAFDDDLIRKNPFEFELVTVLVNDSVRREAVSREVERKFLKFVNEDTHFSRYYEGIYILFKTGMGISEFCGLTISDIDFKNHSINVDHQLQKRATVGYYIEETKTESGKRVLPMTPDVEECFKKIINICFMTVFSMCYQTFLRIYQPCAVRFPASLL